MITPANFAKELDIGALAESSQFVSLLFIRLPAIRWREIMAELGH